MITVEIWSDVNCPFCYIGKRNLESALAQHSGPFEIIWKSFELDPHANPAKGSHHLELLAKKYGRDVSWAQEMNQNMSQMAKNVGLDFDTDHIVPANSFNAHRLIHLAKSLGKQDQMKERLLKAKFVEARDINDPTVLKECGIDVGLPANEISQVLESDQFANEVRHDEQQASALGIRGVPFFVINKQYALSGAQPAEAFLEVFSELK